MEMGKIGSPVSHTSGHRTTLRECLKQDEYSTVPYWVWLSTCELPAQRPGGGGDAPANTLGGCLQALPGGENLQQTP